MVLDPQQKESVKADFATLIQVVEGIQVRTGPSKF